MRKRLLASASLLAAGILNTTLNAQNFEFVADYLRYDDRRQWVSVEGNIEVKTEYGYFYPEYVEYDIANERLYVDGDVRGSLPTGERIIARYSELDFKTQSAILQAVRIMLNTGMQGNAGYFSEEDDERHAEYVVASTCTVCVNDPVPIWQLRAEQVFQDKVNQKVYVRNGFFDLYGLPISWVPFVRFPAPEVRRMDGFLAPTFNATTGESRGLILRYYHPFNEYTDLTGSVQLSSLETQILGADFRHNGKGYRYKGVGRYIRSDDGVEDGRYYTLQKLALKLPYGFDAQARYMYSSDYNVDQNYKFSRPKSNYFYVQKFTNHFWIHGEILDYIPSGEITAKNREYPTVLPHIYGEYSNLLTPYLQLNTDYDILNLKKDFSADITRLSTSIDLKSTQIFPLGILAKTQFGAQAGIYDVFGSDNSDEDGTATRATPFAAVDLQWPFLSSTERADYVLTPRLTMNWSENYDSGVPIPNSDSLFVEHDFVSLFAVNHFTGRDAFESGFRSSLGVSYNMITPENQNFELGLGRIWSSEQLEQIDSIADPILNDWVGYLNYSLDNQWNLYSRFAFDDQLEFSRSEIEFSYDSSKSDFSVEWVRLAPEPEIGFEDIRSEVLLEGDYQFASNWQVDYDVRYDLIDREPFDAGLALTYGNECIEIKSGIDWKFFSKKETETTFQINVELFGLSAKRKEKWAKQTCSFVSNY